MKQTNINTGMQQNMGQTTSSQGQKQVDRPDEIIVNEQEQNEPVNPQDPEEEKINRNDPQAKERAYKDGNKSDSGTENETAPNK